MDLDEVFVKAEDQYHITQSPYKADISMCYLLLMGEKGDDTYNQLI